MTKNNILLIASNPELVKELKGKDNITFLFPLSGFTVGFPTTYNLNEITTTGYIFINRLLDNAGIAEFKKIITNLPANIKGLVFDDLGILNVLMELNINISKILFLNHFNCNYASINIYLSYVDSVVISPDISESEIDEILAKSTKPLVLYTFGHVNIMYSRRTLLTNYNNYFHRQVKNVTSLEDDLTHHKFKIMENLYGTVIYTEKPFNGLRYLTKPNVLYNLINPVFLTNAEIINIINSNTTLENIYPYNYLSTQKTIYKLKERDL